MDLKSFMSKKKSGGEKAKPEDIAKEQIEKYEGKSDEELLGELAKSVEAGKEDGSFSAEALADFVARVSPMLDDKQRARLEEITGKLI